MTRIVIIIRKIKTLLTPIIIINYENDYDADNIDNDSNNDDDEDYDDDDKIAENV